MPSPFISSLFLYSILFLKVCCIPTDTAADASAAWDSSSPQQQPSTVDFGYYDSPSANFLASNNANLDSTTPASITDNTFGISIGDLGSSSSSSSQQDLPGNPANGAGPPLLLSSDECDKSQNGDGWHPNAGTNRKRKNKRQLRNCPNPYLTRPNPGSQTNTNSIKTLENGDEDSGRTIGGGGATEAPTMAIPGLVLQQKPQPNLSLCPDVQRPIPVCAREDIKVPMGDSFLIPKCRACKLFFWGGGFSFGFFRLRDILNILSSLFRKPPCPFTFSNLPISNTKSSSQSSPPSRTPAEGWG